MQQGLAAGDRRSSVVLVTFGVTEHKRGCYERLARQVRQTGKAISLALLCVPLALALEPVAVLSRQGPAEDFPQASCEDLSMDRRGVGYQATAGFATWMAQMSLAIMLIATVPRTPRVLPHLLVGTLATCAYLLLYMRTVFASPREAFWLSGPSVVFVVSFAAPFSFFVWYLATARPGCKLAALLLVACVLLPMLITLFSILTVLYIVLSEQVSGFAGHIINGVAYPLAMVSNRKTLLELLRAVATGDSVNFAGISVLGLEIISSTPQFYVLTRIDGKAQFLGSVLACFVIEVVGAVITARATNAQIYLRPRYNREYGLPRRTGLEQSERVAKALVSTAAVGPDEPSTPPASTLNRGEPAAPDAPEPATPGALASLGGSAPEQLQQQGQSERIRLAKLLRATKLAHEELGEKTSLWIGCSVAAWFEGAHNVSGTAAKVLALVLFEALSDIAKEAIYAASKIEVGHVGFRFHGPLFLAIALIGGAACGGVFNAVRAACMIGDDVVDALG